MTDEFEYDCKLLKQELKGTADKGIMEGRTSDRERVVNPEENELYFCSYRILYTNIQSLLTQTANTLH